MHASPPQHIPYLINFVGEGYIAPPTRNSPLRLYHGSLVCSALPPLEAQYHAKPPIADAELRIVILWPVYRGLAFDR
jgi:hypothetical protein